MNMYDEFKIKVIELLHGNPYEEAVRKEKIVEIPTDTLTCGACNETFTWNEYENTDEDRCPKCKAPFSQSPYSPPHEYYSYTVLNKKIFSNLPITLERVLRALRSIVYSVDMSLSMTSKNIIEIYIFKTEKDTKCISVQWKLVKDDGFTAADHTYQSLETIQSLLKILTEDSV